MKLWRGLGGLPRAIWILFFAIFVNRAGTMVLPYLVIYLSRALHFSPGRAGSVLAVYGLGGLLTAPVAGVLCDRYGSARLMKISLFASGALLLLFPLSRSFIPVLAMALALAASAELFRPASLAIIGQLIKPDQRKPTLALLRLAVNLGMSIGPALGGFLSQISFNLIFWIDGGTAILAGGVLAAGLLRQAKVASRATAPTVPLRFKGLPDTNYIYFLLAIVPIFLVFFQHISTMPLFLIQELHLPATVYGLMFTLNTCLIIFLEVPLNLATAHWPYRTTLALGAFLCSAGFGGLALAQGRIGVALTVIVWTFGEMILLPGMTAYALHVAPAPRQGEYMGFYTMAFHLAFALGPWVGNGVRGYFGGRSFWVVMFLVGTTSVAMMMRLDRAKPAPDAREPLP